MSGGFKFYHRAGPQPRMVARKCIVCGTTNPEHKMKPFLLIGEELTTWTNWYFNDKGTKLLNFYAKLQYTFNPYTCVAHFKHPGPSTRSEPSLLKAGKRTCSELLTDGEEPPTIKRITEKKASPPPEEPTAPRSEEEVNNAVMSILKQAREAMDKEEETMKILKKITRKVVGKNKPDTPVKRKKKRKRERVKERKVDGNEADSDNSLVDVEAIDSEEEKTDGNSEESDSADDGSAVISVGKPSSSEPDIALPAPPRLVNVPRIRSPRPYLIAAPKVLKRESRILPGVVRRPNMMMHVPKRLTLTAGQACHRPSWVGANPGQQTLAAVLQRFWNDDGPSSPNLEKTPRRSLFGRTMIPGTRTKFMPAAILHPKLKLKSPSPSKTRVYHPSIRDSALLYNPPLSPSRIIIGSEVTVETTYESDAEQPKTPILSSSSFSSSSSFNSEEGSDVDVCGHSGDRLPIVGNVIEKNNSTRSRSISSVRSISALYSSSSYESDSSVDEDVEVDVETIDEAPEKEVEPKKKDTAEPKEKDTSESKEKDTVESMKKDKIEPKEKNTVATRPNVDKARPVLVPTVATAGHTDRRKQHMPAYSDGPNKMYYRTVEQRQRIIMPPSAVVKPPTKLLSSGQYSMRELLHAQARAAAGQPIRIDTRGLLSGKTFSALHLKKISKLQQKTPRSLQPQSEWSRLEKVMELKMAERKAQLAREKKKKGHNSVDLQMLADNPPPVLDRVDEKEETQPMIKGEKDESVNRFPGASMESLPGGLPARRCKVLRLRFHKKGNEVDISKMKVLDRWRCPKGVGREEEVSACPSIVDFSIDRKKMDKSKKNMEDKKETNQVTNPSLVIDKTEVMELKEKMKPPPPIPIVGIPDRVEIAARKEMYEKKRIETAIRAGIRYGKMRTDREEWQRKKMIELNGMYQGIKDGKEEIDEEEMEEEALVAEAMEIVKIAKAEKIRGPEEEATRERERMAKKYKENTLMWSDIENDEHLEAKDISNEMNEEDDEDEEWTMKGTPIVKKGDNEEERDIRRKSHRLKEKRASIPKSQRTLIWKASDDEELTPAPASADKKPTVETGKKKRGRPRLNIAAPPPKKKREENVMMTEAEKDVLSRVFTPMGGEKESSTMSSHDPPMETNETENAKDDEPVEKMAELEREEPKPAGDGPLRMAKRVKMPWSWKQRLGANLTMHNEMGGRLCNYCMKHQKRYMWIPNEAIALMDHARTHCIETLMCPNKDCTYMNTLRSRIAQHVSYVHKKWGMPIDLAEVYPSMRNSLMIRLRHCFPDLPSVSVCRICRVAVRPDHKHHRRHASLHLEKQVFECSRSICTLKFATAEECLDHIKKTNCHGSVKRGMTDEMEDEMANLLLACFGKNPFPRSIKIVRQVDVTENVPDGDDNSNTPSTSNPLSQSMAK